MHSPSQPQQRAIALLSGGLDSSVATALGVRETTIAHAITFAYGQRALSQEIAASQSLCGRLGIPHEVVEVPLLARITQTALVDRHSPLPHMTPQTVDDGAAEHARSVWVPNRNGLFLACAAAVAEARGAGRIIAGFNREEAATFPDNSQAFIAATNAALALSTMNKVEVECPTAAMAKAEIAQAFCTLELDPNALWSCYEGGDKHCGECESCARTIRAFQAIGAWDRIRHRFH